MCMCVFLYLFYSWLFFSVFIRVNFVFVIRRPKSYTKLGSCSFVFCSMQLQKKEHIQHKLIRFLTHCGKSFRLSYISCWMFFAVVVLIRNKCPNCNHFQTIILRTTYIFAFNLLLLFLE